MLFSIPGDEDFVVTETVISFMPDEDMACGDIPITDDSEPEPEEQFTVEIKPQPNDTFVVGETNETTVTIIDNDGKQYSYYLSSVL